MNRPPSSQEDSAAASCGRGRARDVADRQVIDQLPANFTLDLSESEWLLTLLSADELRFIFEGPTNGKTQD